MVHNFLLGQIGLDNKQGQSCNIKDQSQLIVNVLCTIPMIWNQSQISDKVNHMHIKEQGSMLDNWQDPLYNIKDYG